MQVRPTSILPNPRRHVRKRCRLILRLEPSRAAENCSRAKQLIQEFEHPRQLVSYMLIFAGAGLLMFVAGTYAWMYIHQRVLLYRWNRDQASAQSRQLTKLSIPRIQLEDVVLEGASRHSLLLGPAHLAGSAVPGEPGNAVIAGHRDTFFRHIHSLRYGDDIYILRSGRRLHYVVRSRRIVRPYDLSVLGASQDSEITLITCYPTNAIGPAPKRLVVVAKLAGGT